MRIKTLRLALGAGLLAAALTGFAASRADAVPLPNTPLPVGDTGGGFIALYPFNGQPQTQFAPIGIGQLNFTLDVTGVNPDLLDVFAFVEIRMDIGVQGNTQYVNIVGPVQTGTDDEGLLLGGTLQMFEITKWSFATDGTPIALSYFNMLPEGVQGTLSVDFVDTTPLPGTLPLFAGGLGVIATLTWRRRKSAPRTSHA